MCFYGHIFSAKGIQADPVEIDFIQQAKFSLCLVCSTAPLRALTRTDAEWKWTTDGTNVPQQPESCANGTESNLLLQPNACILKAHSHS